MASSADLVARAPLYPAPDLVAYLDRIEADVYARAPLYSGPDIVAYLAGRPVQAAASTPITGTAAITEGDDTVAGTGTVGVVAAGGWRKAWSRRR